MSVRQDFGGGGFILSGWAQGLRWTHVLRRTFLKRLRSIPRS